MKRINHLKDASLNFKIKTKRNQLAFRLNNHKLKASSHKVIIPCQAEEMAPSKIQL